MKIGLIDAVKPVSKSMPSRTAMLKGIGMGLAAAVILTAAAAPLVKNKESETHEE